MDMSGYAYICSAGETFDSIARQVYGDERYAVELLCANPEYAGQTIFFGTETLYLPSIDIPVESADEMSAEPIRAPWKE